VIFASSIGQIAHPFFIAFAWLIAFYYRLIPNYAIAIALLTITVMIVVFPITRKATRSMMKMQLLAPEMKSLQNKYKAKPSMSVAERREAREHLNEEMMALYRENGVSPTGGCLPLFMQLPAFWILYGTIKGLIHATKQGAIYKADPLYINSHSLLYQNIIHSKVIDGHASLSAFGIDIADSVRSGGLSWPAKLPFIVLILAAIGLQYTQMRQLSGRNPAAAQANPQMQQMQKFFPLILGVIYITIPAAVNVYFIVSSIFRIGQQELMYRRDPHIRASMEKLRSRTSSPPKADPTPPVPRTSGTTPPGPKASPQNGNGRRPAPRNGAKNTSKNGAKPAGQEATPRPHPRAQNKRARRAR
jgi:YidC/Oxa1 family membrane protein insertase